MQLDILSKRDTTSDAIRHWTTRRILFSLGKLQGAVRSVRVRLRDDNGPKGGVDKRCLMEARLARSGRVVAEVRDADLYTAISRAAQRLGRRVRTEIERRRDHHARHPRPLIPPH